MNNYRRNGFHVFSEQDGYPMLETLRSDIRYEINCQKDNYILNINKEEHIQHIFSEYSIFPLEIFTDQLSGSTTEELISA